MPAWMTPLLAPVWPVAGSGARSSTTASRSGRRRLSSRATARPTIPPPTTARSHSAGGTAVGISADLPVRVSAPAEVEICIDHPTDHLRKACARPRRSVSLSARLLLRHAAPQELEVGVDHQPDHLVEAGARLPSQLLAGFAGVADQVLDLRGTKEAGVDPDVLLRVEPDVVEGDLHKVANRVRLARGDHVVVGLVLLEHEPHGLDVVLGIAPISLGIKVAEGELLLK